MHRPGLPRPPGNEHGNQRRRYRKNTFVTGKSTASETLNGVKKPNKVNVFVTRLPANCSVSDVTKLIRDNLTIEAEAEKLTTNHDELFSSFRVTCESDNPEILLDPMLWPQDCLFRKWFPPRRQRNTAPTQVGAMHQPTGT